MKSPPLAIPQLASTSLRCVEIDVPNLTLAELESASDRGAFAVRSNDALIRNRQALTFMSRLRDLHGSPQNCRLRSFVASPNALHWLGALQHDSPGEDKEVAALRRVFVKVGGPGWDVEGAPPIGQVS